MADTFDTLRKVIFGDPDNEIIKAGTTALTRGTGTVATGLIGIFLLLDQLGDSSPWKNMNVTQKLAFVLGLGIIWAMIATADIIARGIATRNLGLVALPPGLTAKNLQDEDTPGWRVVGMRVAHSGDDATPEFLIAKGREIRWLPGDKLRF